MFLLIILFLIVAILLAMWIVKERNKSKPITLAPTYYDDMVTSRLSTCASGACGMKMPSMPSIPIDIPHMGIADGGPIPYMRSMPHAPSISSINQRLEEEKKILSRPVVYDRNVYADQSSRTRGVGDPIRGDIVPTSVMGPQFVPSVNLRRDLQRGAVGILMPERRDGRIAPPINDMNWN
jgi:Family of unknown function (DUF5850)